MPEVTLRRPQANDSEELGRICYEAFKDISESHGFESDFPTVEFARIVIAASIARENQYGTAAFLDGRAAGSNFLTLLDEVGGVGPVSVDPPAQGHGIGRRLMLDVLEYARNNGIERVRLVQDAFNVVSMSLYSSLGFDTKAPLGMLLIAPAEQPDESIRRVEPGDLDWAGELGREMYKVSRRDEFAVAPMMGMTPILLERGGRRSGYLIPGFVGHGLAETEEDMLAMMGEAARQSQYPVRILVPLIEGSLFRKALARGHRLGKMMNLMALGPYEEPEGVWIPSVMY